MPSKELLDKQPISEKQPITVFRAWMGFLMRQIWVQMPTNHTYAAVSSPF